MTAAARKLCAYIRAHGLREADLAHELGVNRSQVTRWLAGTYQPQIGIQRRINRRFGIKNEWVEKS